MIVSHKIQLLPSNATENYFRQACGTSRAAFNWALAEWENQYKEGGKPNVNELDKMFNRVKRETFPWMYDEKGALVVSNCITQQAIKKDLKTAWQKFFRKEAKRPRFKKKGRDKDSFYLDNTKFKLEGKRVALQKVGPVRITQRLRFDGKIMGATISRTADKWFIAVQVEIAEPTPAIKQHGVTGVDLGVNAMATLTDGTRMEAPAPLKAALKKLRRLQRHLPKRPGDGQKNGVKVRVESGSKNHADLKNRIARQHKRIADIRKNAQHQASAYLTRKYETVVIENLNVKGMTKNHRLARSINDVGFFELRRQVEYKMRREGGTVIVADRWMPSSKTCSNCGSYKKTLSLNVRTFRCDDCGMVLDRDHNAAINLAVLAEEHPSLPGEAERGHDGDAAINGTSANEPGTGQGETLSDPDRGEPRHPFCVVPTHAGMVRNRYPFRCRCQCGTHACGDGSQPE